MKRNELLTYATEWIKLKMIMLHERAHTKSSIEIDIFYHLIYMNF